MNDTFQRYARAHHEAVRQWKAETGRPVIGYLCCVVPEEIICAAGAVFAESSIISQIHRGEPVERIAAGVVWGVAIRVTDLIKRVGVSGDLVLVGGGARNPALVSDIEGMAGVRPVVPEQPHFATAIGAAIGAHRAEASLVGRQSGRS